ncbi:hypothetical protein K3495_g2534 [Podosphaera aphanis]|nr:hypothetical protein K3495_g2534 [Podosphaera aphanis]
MERRSEKISHYAMKLAREQYQKSLTLETEPCTNVFTPTMGIPCRHRIKSMLAANTLTTLTVHDFDHFWWLEQLNFHAPTRATENLDWDGLIDEIHQQNKILMPHQQRLFFQTIQDAVSPKHNSSVQNPVAAQTRGRPTGSPRRDPSAFECVEQSFSHQIQPAQRTRSCRICDISGHNDRTYPLNRSASDTPVTQNSELDPDLWIKISVCLTFFYLVIVPGLKFPQSYTT